MRRYLFQRLVSGLVVVWIVITFVFVTIRVLPADFAVQQVANNYFFGGQRTSANFEDAVFEAREYLGLNDSIAEQYGDFLGDFFRGDLGTSFRSKESVWSELSDAIPYSLQLGTMTMTIGVLLALPIGIISATRRNTWIDYLLRSIAIFGLAAPSFWIAAIGTLLALRFDILELDVVGAPGIWEDFWGSLQLFAIPAVAGGFASGAVLMRLLRSQMLDVLREDYVRTAAAKGLSQRVVILRHALRNAIIPVVTVLGLVFAGVIGGTVILETMFNIPGMGRLIFQAINTRDVPVVQGAALLICIVVVLNNMIIDFMYFKIDPRITLAASGG